MYKPVTILIFALFFFTKLQAQSQLLPLYHQLQNKLGLSLYSTQHPKHTSIQPFEMRDLSPGTKIDSLISGEQIPGSIDESWLNRKLFYEHLLEFESSDYRLYGDFIVDMGVGKDLSDSKNTFVNTRGVVFGGSVADNFSFYTEFFENQAIFPKFLDTYVRKYSIVPGQGYQRSYVANTFDYAYSSAVISYRPSKYLSLQGGQGKNFIGDGYRSLLLSDVAFNYPYFKITADLWKIKYMMLWAEFQDISKKRTTGDRFAYEKKSGVFHYLDIHMTDRLTLGFFEGIIWLPKDSSFVRGFEWNYLNPIIFFRPVEFSIGSPDNVVMGLNWRYIVSSRTSLYGQVMIDELTIDEYFNNKGYWANKYGIQAGVKSFEVGNISGLFMQGEVNLASPYTYSHDQPLKNYGHYNQSLAHPLGANFYEFLGISSYELGRFDFRVQLNFARYGSDSLRSKSMGQDIYRSYNERGNDYGNVIGQGVNNKLLYTDLRVSYLLNPLTNLRIEASYINRSLETGNSTSRTSWISFGVRSSFRNLYYDF